jgi:hypothetical protein
MLVPAVFAASVSPARKPPVIDTVARTSVLPSTSFAVTRLSRATGAPCWM